MCQDMKDSTFSLLIALADETRIDTGGNDE